MKSSLHVNRWALALLGMVGLLLGLLRYAALSVPFPSADGEGLVAPDPLQVVPQAIAQATTTIILSLTLALVCRAAAERWRLLTDQRSRRLALSAATRVLADQRASLRREREGLLADRRDRSLGMDRDELDEHAEEDAALRDQRDFAIVSLAHRASLVREKAEVEAALAISTWLTQQARRAPLVVASAAAGVEQSLGWLFALPIRLATTVIVAALEGLGAITRHTIAVVTAAVGPPLLSLLGGLRALARRLHWSVFSTEGRQHLTVVGGFIVMIVLSTVLLLSLGGCQPARTSYILVLNDRSESMDACGGHPCE